MEKDNLYKDIHRRGRDGEKFLTIQYKDKFLYICKRATWKLVILTSEKNFWRPDALQWRPDARPFTVDSGAPGASGASGPHCPRSLTSGRPNNNNSARNWSVFGHNSGACGALTPAFLPIGVTAPSVRNVAFQIHSMPLGGASGA